jgi:hypothetical protein
MNTFILKLQRTAFASQNSVPKRWYNLSNENKVHSEYSNISLRQVALLFEYFSYD